jgi:serine/threonine protein phosphatase 1
MYLYQPVEINKRGRDFFCGDIHGMYTAVQAALARVHFDEQTDRLFCTGDLIDRGPDSLRCLQLLNKPWFFSVRGNHEQMLIDYVLNGEFRAGWLWRLNGGDWGDEVSGDELQALAQLAERRMPYLIELECSDHSSLGICHAEYPLADWHDVAQLSNDSHRLQALLWSRQRLQKKNTDPVAHIGHTLHGHCIVAKPICLGNCWFIDTGAFISGRLDLIEAPQRLSEQA